MAKRNHMPPRRSTSGPFCYDFMNGDCTRGRCLYLHGTQKECEEYAHTGHLAPRLKKLEKDDEGRYVYATNRTPIPSSQMMRTSARVPEWYSSSSTSEHSPKAPDSDDVGNLGDFVDEAEDNMDVFPIGDHPRIQDTLDMFHDRMYDDCQRALEAVSIQQAELQRDRAKFEETKQRCIEEWAKKERDFEESRKRCNEEREKLDEDSRKLNIAEKALNVAQKKLDEAEQKKKEEIATVQKGVSADLNKITQARKEVYDEWEKIRQERKETREKRQQFDEEWKKVNEEKQKIIQKQKEIEQFRNNLGQICQQTLNRLGDL